MAIILNLFFSTHGPKLLHAFHEKCVESPSVQQELLNHILRKNENSRYGRKHRFHKIHSYKDFQRHVPIASYEDLEPYVISAMNGLARQLTREKPSFFATTSGTTDAPKFIPETRESCQAKSWLMRVWLSKLFQDHPDIFSHRILTVVSPEVESHTRSGVPYGAESGHGYRAMPHALKAAYSSPYEVFTIGDYDAKYYTLLRLAAEQDISVIYAVNPSTVLLLGECLGEYAEEIIRDIRDGTLSHNFQVPLAIREMLLPRLEKNKERAAFLEEACARGGGVLLPRYLWPKLACVCCWTGGTVGMYVEKFHEYFSPALPIRDIGYFASEHRGSVPLWDKESSGVLAVPTNFYEFYPAEGETKPRREDLQLSHELEKGRHYYVYVTTRAGLYRYDMNDIIEVTGFYGKTPVIRFIQKGKGVVSYTGEKLYEAQVMEAAKRALESHETPSEFIAAVGELIENKPRYAFLVEFSGGIRPDVGRLVADRIEKELLEINREYKSKRASGRIKPLVLRAVKPGEFDRFRKSQVEGGRNDGQFKILRLTSDASFSKNFALEGDIPASPGPADRTRRYRIFPAIIGSRN